MNVLAKVELTFLVLDTRIHLLGSRGVLGLAIAVFGQGLSFLALESSMCSVSSLPI